MVYAQPYETMKSVELGLQKTGEARPSPLNASLVIQDDLESSPAAYQRSFTKLPEHGSLTLKSHLRQGYQKVVANESLRYKANQAAGAASMPLTAKKSYRTLQIADKTLAVGLNSNRKNPPQLGKKLKLDLSRNDLQKMQAD